MPVVCHFLGVKVIPHYFSYSRQSFSALFTPKYRARCSKIQVTTQLRRAKKTKNKLEKQESQMGFAWRQGAKAARCRNFSNIILQDSNNKKKKGHLVTTEIGWD